MSAFKLAEIRTDLFQIPQTYSLAYSCAADFQAERGSLGWQIGLIFGQTEELQRQQIFRGNVAVLEGEGPRYIYHLVVKDTLFQKATYHDLEAVLICLRHHMRNHKASKVAMPRICCGKRDALQWSQVREMILRIFAQEYNTEIIVCTLRPTKVTIPCCRIFEEQHKSAAAKTALDECSVLHAVSGDFAMCQNIAIQSKCKHEQAQELFRQDAHSGNVAVLRDGNRFIYNLVTKGRHHEKSTYIALFYALLATREHMLEYGVRRLVLPRLGCGIERLEWQRVKDILELVFSKDNIEIIAYTSRLPCHHFSSHNSSNVKSLR